MNRDVAGTNEAAMDREDEQGGHGRHTQRWIVLRREGTRMLKSGAARMKAATGRGTGSREQRGSPTRMGSMQDRFEMSAKRAGRWDCRHNGGRQGCQLGAAAARSMDADCR
jgi:hypothetical protein